MVVVMVVVAAVVVGVGGGVGGRGGWGGGEGGGGVDPICQELHPCERFHSLTLFCAT